MTSDQLLEDSREDVRHGQNSVLEPEILQALINVAKAAETFVTKGDVGRGSIEYVTAMREALAALTKEMDEP